jgi:hypothetical protein
MRQASNASCCRTINRHREFVAVDEIDTVPRKQIQQTFHSAWVYGAVQPKYLGSELIAPEQIAKPAHPVLRTNGHNGVTSAPKLVGQTEYHHLRAAGFV